MNKQDQKPSPFHSEGTICGRFILLTDLSVIVKSFNIQEIACNYRSGNNISPGQEIAAFVHDDKNRLVC
jgi:putative SOS response-associated peptidase YedK